VVVVVVVVVVEVAKVVAKVVLSLSDVTAGSGTRSYSYPVMTVPPCDGVCPSL